MFPVRVGLRAIKCNHSNSLNDKICALGNEASGRARYHKQNMRQNDHYFNGSVIYTKKIGKNCAKILDFQQCGENSKISAQISC